MSKLLQDSAFFCLAISLIGYEIGIILRQKTKLALCNPLLISIVFVIIILNSVGNGIFHLPLCLASVSLPMDNFGLLQQHNTCL